MSSVSVERSVDLKAAPSALWCLVTDTERLNRAIGLGPITLTDNSDGSSARHIVHTVSGGFPLVYEERPFEWVENERFTIKRVVRKGLARSLENTFELEELPGGGTRITVRITVEPKLWILKPIVRLQIKRFVARIISEYLRVDGGLSAGDSVDFSTTESKLDAGELSRAAVTLREAVSDDLAAIADTVIEYVRTAHDSDVDRMRPYELADRWETDRRNTLSVFLTAVTAGLVDLRWDLVCPSCRTASDRLGSLSELTEHGRCQLCDIGFEVELDNSVEATFRPARGVRTIDEGPYCIGGPARTPHVVTQSIVPAGGTADLKAPRDAGPYRLFARGGAIAALIVGDGPDIVESNLDDDVIDPGELSIASGGIVRVHNPDDRELHAKIERLDWAALAATAHAVSTMPAFRERFSADVLRPGVALQVARVPVMFTDLTDSTAMYSEIGDARAFQVVHDHFELLIGIIEQHGGTLVKTIGDAIMAAFCEEADAMRAAVAMHKEFPAFRANRSGVEKTRVKIGIYAGPCYAVTANGILDYFGQSVNLAARLQGAAGAGEIVVARELADRALENGWLDSGTSLVPFDAVLKGVEQPVAATRIAVDLG